MYKKEKLKSLALLIAYDPKKIVQNSLKLLRQSEANPYHIAFVEAHNEYYEEHGWPEIFTADMDWDETATRMYEYFLDIAKKSSVISEPVMRIFLIEGFGISADHSLIEHISKRLAFIVNKV